MTAGCGERGAAAVLAVGMVGAVLALSTALIPVAGAFLASQRAANAADAAALAAADVASGAFPGEPCAAAAAAATANGGVLSACELRGAVARVEVSLGWWVFALSAAARAGPPGTP
ncbi:Rv3654c family TadE-like protein [Microterricola pindariensis]|uniref:Rv3654c family TadE-like protein n=1 Tax=Microterricola pindariensis TaxID=478010 RepID=UPI001E648BA7|nr:Rv3654c family TadE-like protein [Microterricola pindariensis]